MCVCVCARAYVCVCVCVFSSEQRHYLLYSSSAHTHTHTPLSSFLMIPYLPYWGGRGWEGLGGMGGDGRGWAEMVAERIALSSSCPLCPERVSGPDIQLHAERQQLPRVLHLRGACESPTAEGACTPLKTVSCSRMSLLVSALPFLPSSSTVCVLLTSLFSQAVLWL